MLGSGQTIVSSTGTLNVGGGSVGLIERTLVNAGQVNFFPTGSITMSSNATIDNRTSGELISKPILFLPGASRKTVLNAGVIKKSGGAGRRLFLSR